MAGVAIIATALAIQNLSWGIVSVFAGGLADRYGNLKVILSAVFLYAIGVLWMAFASDAWALSASAGVLVGAGVAGTSFGIVFQMTEGNGSQALVRLLVRWDNLWLCHFHRH